MLGSSPRIRFIGSALALLALAAILMASSKRKGGTFSFIDRVVVRLSVPVEKAVALPAEAVSNAYHDYVALLDVREKNESMRTEIETLREENRQYREALIASERYKELKRFRETLPIPMLPALIVSEDASPWFRSLYIDHGSEDGVKNGMAVVNADGIIGHVIGVASNAAKVLMLTDHNSAVDVIVQRSRARGIVEGRVGGNCRLEYVLRSEDVRIGDHVITSGIGGIYPKGLNVGEVTKVKRKSHGLFQYAEVTPAVDFNKLEEVFVILKLENERFIFGEHEPGTG